MEKGYKKLGFYICMNDIEKIPAGLEPVCLIAG
jgi:hypothetical protein